MAAEEKSLRDELSAAFTKQETPSEPAKETVPPVVENPEVKSDDQTNLADDGIVKSSDPGVGSEARAEPAVAKDPATATEAVVEAPVSLKAAERAEWAKTPKSMQQAFVRRETEVQTALRQSAESRKLADEFNQTVGPYMPLIRASNSTPMVAFKNLMQTAAGLTVGTAQQKAQIIRDIIQNYGVNIEELDKVLSTNLPQQGRQAPGTSEVELHIQKAMQPMYEFMNGINQQRQTVQQRQEAQAEAAINAFQAKNPYFQDLRLEMADQMEIAAQHGREMSMQQAYDLCASMNPTIKAATSQNQAAQQNGAAERAQRAALSVTGSPAGAAPKDSSNMSLRDDLADAWNSVANGGR